MKNRRNLSLKDIGELAAIKRICRLLPAGKDIICGAGDDCAVVRAEAGAKDDLLLTSDAVIEGTHFKTETPPAGIGRKAVGRALSDIAAMGGEPRWALVDIVAPPAIHIKTLDAIYDGAISVAGKYGLAITGGDMARGPITELHVFAVGTVPRDKSILRSGARPGDMIFVTGSLGGSIKGKHISFTPRVAEGAFLREWATSMIDVSDGLASDLRHLTEMSKTGAIIYADNVPLSKAALMMKGKTSALDHALYDGEDFELLFTISPGRVNAFMKAWKKNFSLPCSLIGLMTGRHGIIEFTDKNGVVRRLEKTGYQHFKK